MSNASSSQRAKHPTIRPSDHPTIRGVGERPRLLNREDGGERPRLLNREDGRKCGMLTSPPLRGHDVQYCLAVIGREGRIWRRTAKNRPPGQDPETFPLCLPTGPWPQRERRGCKFGKKCKRNFLHSHPDFHLSLCRQKRPNMAGNVE